MACKVSAGAFSRSMVSVATVSSICPEVYMQEARAIIAGWIAR
jgi:hypothetical protein